MASPGTCWELSSGALAPLARTSYGPPTSRSTRRYIGLYKFHQHPSARDVRVVSIQGTVEACETSPSRTPLCVIFVEQIKTI